MTEDEHLHRCSCCCCCCCRWIRMLMLRCIVSRHKSQHRRRRRIFAGLLLIGLVHTHTCLAWAPSSSGCSHATGWVSGRYYISTAVNHRMYRRLVFINLIFSEVIKRGQCIFQDPISISTHQFQASGSGWGLQYSTGVLSSVTTFSW